MNQNKIEDFFTNNPKPTLLRKIWLWWEHEGKYYHKYLKQNIKNIIYWFPVIWKDRNWDDHYIFEVLKHKLKAQAKYIGGRDIHTRAQQDARRMRLCVSLIEKIQEEEYTMEYMDYSKDRYWFEPLNDGTDCSTWESENISENFDEYFKKYPRIYKKVLKGEGPFTLDGRDDVELKRTVAMNIAHINQDRAHKLLFKIMEENILGWWD